MYSMPQSGTKVSLYIGSAEESGGMIAGCVRTNGATCEGTGTPSNKGFRNEYGKGMDLFPGSIGLTSGETGSLKLLDEEGIKLESTGLLMVHAKTGVRVEGETGISVQAVSDITAMALASATSVLINGTMDMLGTGTALRGSMYQSFAPFDDAPVEGEFDWGGFFKNLLIGIAVTAVLGVAAALTGGILAAALVGATIGAFSATVTGAAGELSSGNVRSTGEAFRDVMVSAFSGAVTGAVCAAGGGFVGKIVGKMLPGISSWGAAALTGGLVDVGGGIVGRGTTALFDKSMSWEEKLAYTFDPTQVAIDFVTGAVIGVWTDWKALKKQSVIPLSPDDIRYEEYWKQKELLSKSACSDEVLYEYLYKIDPDKAINYANTGQWPNDIQIPTSTSVLNNEWGIDWSQVPGGGYVLDSSGNPIKSPYTPQAGDVLDRYGSPDGTYTSPVNNGQAYDYVQRSLPYVEDASKYHQYEVTGDFSDIKGYIDNCKDPVIKAQVEASVAKYYGGDYSKLTAQIGDIAPGFGTTNGGTQVQLPFTVELLEGLGLLREIQ